MEDVERFESIARQVHGLEHLIDHKMRYIGLSKDAYKQFKQHTSIQAPDWIRELLDRSLKPILHAFEIVPDLATARLREKHWIKCYERHGHPLEKLSCNWASHSARSEQESLYQRVYSKFASRYPHDIAQQLTETTLAGYDLVSYDPWKINYNAVLGTLKILSQMPGFGLKLTEIDAAKITFKLFGYRWSDEGEVEA